MQKLEVVNLSAIEKNFVPQMPEPIQKEVTGKDFVSFGQRNEYPDFVFASYQECATLQSIINGCVDYVMGNAVRCRIHPEKAKSELEKCAADYFIFGGFYLQIIRNNKGQVSDFNWLDFRNVRCDKDRNRFWYSEDWSKSYGRVKTIEYPIFNAQRPDPASIIFFMHSGTRETYPNPIWNGAMKSVQIERKIDNFHLGEIDNNFMSSAIINLNNGIPTDEVKAQIEKNFEEKFQGADNSGRLVIIYNDSAENAAKIERLATDDFDKRYESLAKRCREQIFIAFRAIPSLFGLMTESTGFNEQEFQESFKLFNRTVIRPVQQKLVDLLSAVFGDGALEIDPFTLGTENNSNADTETNVD